MTFLSNDPNIAHSKEGKYLQHSQKFDHTTNLQLICNVFDLLLNDSGDSKSRTNENPMRIDKVSNREVIAIMELE